MATTTWPAEIYVFDGTHWVSISPHGMTTLPPATGTTIGGVIVGSGVNVAPDGTISVTHFSGDYNDLTNKPVIQAPVQSDWLATGGDAFIVNKPNYLSQFTNDLSVSAFPNDALYVDAAAAAAAAPIQSIAAGANVAITDDGHGNIVIAATGGGGGTPGGGVVSVSGTAPIKVVDGLNAPVISLVLGAGLKVNSGALEADFSGLATVATSGSYNDLSDKPTIPPAYTLPTASGTVLGGVKVGTGLTMTGEVLSANVTTVPDASTTTKGIIQIADSAAITAGTALRAVDAAGLKAVTDQQTKDFVNVSGDTMTGSLAGIAGSATVQSFSVGKSGTGIHGSSAYDRLFVATKGERRVMVNEAGEISLGNWGANAASIGSGVRLAPERTGTGTVRGVAFATQFDGAAADAQNVFIGGSIAAGTKHYTAMRFPQPSGATPEDTVGIFFESLSGSIASACIEAHANAGTGAWFLNSTGTLPSYHSGQIQSGLGTASVPSVAYYNDADTGTFSPAANTWAVSCGGTEAMRAYSGRVAVGGVGHHSYKFSVEGVSSIYGAVINPSYSAGGDKRVVRLQAQVPDGETAGQIAFLDVYGAVLGAGASAGTTAGVYVRPTVANGDTANYGVWLTLSASGTKNWNTYASGTAPNYFNGQVQTAAGTAAAPSVSIFGDTDTGTFSPAANTWAVSTGGVERLRVQEDGVISIGTGYSTGAAQITVRPDQTKESIFRIDSKVTRAGASYAFLVAPNIQQAGADYYHIQCTAAGGSLAPRNVAAFTIGDSFHNATGYVRAVVCSISEDGGGKERYNIYASGTAPNYFAGQIRSGLGTAAAPSVSISGDTDTGTFSPGANTWAVSTGGVERLRVKSTGGVRYVPLAAAPTTPEEGEVYFDSTTKKLRVYDGTGWVDLN